MLRHFVIWVEWMIDWLLGLTGDERVRTFEGDPHWAVKVLSILAFFVAAFKFFWFLAFGYE